MPMKYPIGNSECDSVFLNGYWRIWGTLDSVAHQFTVYYCDIPDTLVKTAEPEARLKFMRDRYYEKGDSLNVEEKAIFINGYYGLEFRQEYDVISGISRTYLVKNRYYRLEAYYFIPLPSNAIYVTKRKLSKWVLQTDEFKERSFESNENANKMMMKFLDSFTLQE